MSGFESFQQREPITVRIKGILTEYPDGSQILREILQNSDDAGSTEQVTTVYSSFRTRNRRRRVTEQANINHFQ
ncbi:hypothetical protein BC938DRAFT_482626 [Jimgerdemannia flammicorona]|uniref:Sacsin/Nov domain-containing protein n=1 Tax=Jimgerdemannia flammicorona TaxID=994334 RepID=A0A433QDH6_9FUNG|nr:hypothetical protein BC938DRAFT_482626 [Jimgerdemannia flammicorona]